MITSNQGIQYVDNVIISFRDDKEKTMNKVIGLTENTNDKGVQIIRVHYCYFTFDKTSRRDNYQEKNIKDSIEMSYTVFIRDEIQHIYHKKGDRVHYFFPFYLRNSERETTELENMVMESHKKGVRKVVKRVLKENLLLLKFYSNYCIDITRFEKNWIQFVIDINKGLNFYKKTTSPIFEKIYKWIQRTGININPRRVKNRQRTFNREIALKTLDIAFLENTAFPLSFQMGNVKFSPKRKVKFQIPESRTYNVLTTDEIEFEKEKGYLPERTIMYQDRKDQEGFTSLESRVPWNNDKINTFEYLARYDNDLVDRKTKRADKGRNTAMETKYLGYKVIKELSGLSKTPYRDIIKVLGVKAIPKGKTHTLNKRGRDTKRKDSYVYYPLSLAEKLAGKDLPEKFKPKPTSLKNKNYINRIQLGFQNSDRKSPDLSLMFKFKSKAPYLIKKRDGSFIEKEKLVFFEMNGLDGINFVWYEKFLIPSLKDHKFEIYSDYEKIGLYEYKPERIADLLKLNNITINLRDLEYEIYNGNKWDFKSFLNGLELEAYRISLSALKNNLNKYLNEMDSKINTV